MTNEKTDVAGDDVVKPMVTKLVTADVVYGMLCASLMLHIKANEISGKMKPNDNLDTDFIADVVTYFEQIINACLEPRGKKNREKEYLDFLEIIKLEQTAKGRIIH